MLFEIYRIIKMATEEQSVDSYDPYDPLDTPAKKIVRNRIRALMDSEIKEECKGLAIIVLSVEEHEIVLKALKEVSARKRREFESKRSTRLPKRLTLNIVR